MLPGMTEAERIDARQAAGPIPKQAAEAARESIWLHRHLRLEIPTSKNRLDHLLLRRQKLRRSRADKENDG